MNQRALAAEFIGTFMLMSSVLGAAFYSFGAPAGAAGILGVAFSIGFTVMALAFSIGHVSGGHFNPAVTLGLVAGGRVKSGDAIGYIIAQCLGAVAACALFYIIGQTPPTFAANGYDSLSMLRAPLLSVFLTETVLTAFFLIVIMGATSKRAPAGFAPIAIGLALTAIHIMAIPVSQPGQRRVRWRHRVEPAVAVLGGADPRRRHRRHDCPLAAGRGNVLTARGFTPSATRAARG